MESKYTPVKLGELLKYRKEFIKIDDVSIYKRVTAKLHAQGVLLRDEVEGLEIKTKNQQLCKSGDFLVAEIDAKVGGFGIIPEELEGAIVSSHYFLFGIDESRLNRQFLNYYLKTDSFQNQINAQGSTNYAAIRPADIFEIEIFLPSLNEQKCVVAIIDRMMERINEARWQQVEAVEYVEKIWESLLSRTFAGYGVPTYELASELISKQAIKYCNMEILNYNGAHPQKPNIHSDGLYEIPKNWVWTDLGSILTHLIDCINDTPDFSEEKTEYIGLKSTNIRPYIFDLSEKWYVKEDDFLYWNRREIPKAGDLILTREAPLGNICIIPKGVKTCLTQRLILLRCDEEFINPRYLLHYLNSVHFKKQALDMCRGLTTPHIRVKDVPKVMIPLPPLQTQNQIVSCLDSMKTKLDEIKKIQTETEQDMGELVPSVLQKAFAGEL